MQKVFLNLLSASVFWLTDAECVANRLSASRMNNRCEISALKYNTHSILFSTSILSPDSTTPEPQSPFSTERILEICRAASLTPDLHLDRVTFSLAISKLSSSNNFFFILDDLLDSRPDLRNERFLSHSIVLSHPGCPFLPPCQCRATTTTLAETSSGQCRATTCENRGHTRGDQRRPQSYRQRSQSHLHNRPPLAKAIDRRRGR